MQHKYWNPQSFRPKSAICIVVDKTFISEYVVSARSVEHNSNTNL